MKEEEESLSSFPQGAYVMVNLRELMRVAPLPNCTACAPLVNLGCQLVVGRIPNQIAFDFQLNHVSINVHPSPCHAY